MYFLNALKPGIHLVHLVQTGNGFPEMTYCLNYVWNSHHRDLTIWGSSRYYLRQNNAKAIYIPLRWYSDDLVKIWHSWGNIFWCCPQQTWYNKTKIIKWKWRRNLQNCNFVTALLSFLKKDNTTARPTQSVLYKWWIYLFKSYISVSSKPSMTQ